MKASGADRHRSSHAWPREISRRSPQVAADPGMRHFADSPKVVASQVLDVLTSASPVDTFWRCHSPGDAAKNTCCAP